MHFCKRAVKILSAGFGLLWWPLCCAAPRLPRHLRTMSFVLFCAPDDWETSNSRHRLGNSVSLSFLKSCGLEPCARPWVQRNLSPADVTAVSPKSFWWMGHWNVPRAGCRNFVLLHMGSDVPEHSTPHCPSFLAVSSSAWRIEEFRLEGISGGCLVQPLTSSLWRKENHLFKLSAITTCSCLALCASRHPYLNV